MKFSRGILRRASQLQKGDYVYLLGYVSLWSACFLVTNVTVRGQTSTSVRNFRPAWPLLTY